MLHLRRELLLLLQCQFGRLLLLLLLLRVLLPYAGLSRRCQHPLSLMAWPPAAMLLLWHRASSSRGPAHLPWLRLLLLLGVV